jgi:large subunit ribosomal protein L10
LDRADKVKQIDELKDRFERARAAFIANYRGLGAIELTEFRRSLKDNSNELRIVRNTLARRAIAGTGYEPLSEHFKDTTAVVFSYEDAAGAAKTLAEFAKKQPKFEIRSGVLGTKIIGLDEITALSKLPSRDELLGKLLGSLNSPTTGLVGVLSGVPRAFVCALAAIRDQKAAG